MTSKATKKSIHTLIREAREDKGWSKSKLARECGVTRGTVQWWEREAEQGGFAPNRSHQPNVAKHLGLSFGDLIEAEHAPVSAEGLSAQALQVARMFDAIEDERQQQQAYAIMMTLSEQLEPIDDQIEPIEAEVVPPRKSPKRAPAHKK